MRETTIREMVAVTEFFEVRRMTERHKTTMGAGKKTMSEAKGNSGHQYRRNQAKMY